MKRTIFFSVRSSPDPPIFKNIAVRSSPDPAKIGFSPDPVRSSPATVLISAVQDHLSALKLQKWEITFWENCEAS